MEILYDGPRMLYKGRSDSLHSVQLLGHLGIDDKICHVLTLNVSWPLLRLAGLLSHCMEKYNMYKDNVIYYIDHNITHF